MLFQGDPSERITLHELVFHPWVSFQGNLPLLGDTAMRVLPPPWVLPKRCAVGSEDVHCAMLSGGLGCGVMHCCAQSKVSF